jgi:hypothetical protein
VTETLQDGSQREFLVMNETKGPSAGLGDRRGLDGGQYQQGHPKYVESLADAYRNRDRIAADAIEEALENGTLQYRLVKPEIGTDNSWAGISVRQFDLTGYQSGSK